jgi:hypothetical protein
MNEDLERGKASVAAKATATNFDGMDEKAFGGWIDALPMEEFFGLLHLHDEFQATGEITVPDVPVNAPKAPEPDDSSWVVYTGEGVPPLPEDAMCWVLFPDGGTAGPNRVDAFLWGGDGQATILAYAPAVLVH